MRETGFADRNRMRRVFLRILGQGPWVLRRDTRLDGPSDARMGAA